MFHIYDKVDYTDLLVLTLYEFNGTIAIHQAIKSRERKIVLSVRPPLLLIMNITGRIVAAPDCLTNAE